MSVSVSLLLDGDYIENHFSHRVVAYQNEHEHEAVVSVRPGGIAVKRIDDMVLRRSPTPDAPRGEIYGRSAKSNRRLMDKLSSIDLDDVARGPGEKFSKYLFVCLTYPEEYPSGLDAKPHLKAFRKRLERRFRSFRWALWVEEFQRRGAPHFHLVLVFNRRVNVAWFREWLSTAWFEVVRSGTIKHLQAGTNCEPVHFGKGVGCFMAYLGKEIGLGRGKSYQALGVDQETGEVVPSGRTWGFWREENVPFVVVAAILISSRVGWAKFKRAIADYFSKSRYLSTVSDMVAWGGGLLYGDGLELLNALLPAEGWQYLEGLEVA